MPIAIEGGRLSIFNNQFMSDFDPATAPDSEALGWLKRQHKENAQEAFTEAISLIEADLDSFPEYRDNTYILPEEQVLVDNTDKGFFMP